MKHIKEIIKQRWYYKIITNSLSGLKKKNLSITEAQPNTSTSEKKINTK